VSTPTGIGNCSSASVRRGKVEYSYSPRIGVGATHHRGKSDRFSTGRRQICLWSRLALRATRRSAPGERPLKAAHAPSWVAPASFADRRNFQWTHRSPADVHAIVVEAPEVVSVEAVAVQPARPHALKPGRLDSDHHTPRNPGPPALAVGDGGAALVGPEADPGAVAGQPLERLVPPTRPAARHAAVRRTRRDRCQRRPISRRFWAGCAWPYPPSPRLLIRLQRRLINLVVAPPVAG
jgi:hypothetical protein